ncbi:phosphopantetheine-binding protein [Tissierella sp. MB52-C2]|uniref:phosphopantetheine-binding protein n=1 Tax=Tissierella sp. MB52-C2 TaxID=3070999 RepID=UPI00280B9961|nr:phosphopantetheine-binding protein [Tissierella sp. MB52-C2]WMM26072.1 phosphopantetheine-binding protein [Tissierella sp. MB52-C2]
MHNKKNIEKKVIEIIERVCSRKVEQIDTNIFINPFYMSSRELAYIFVELEKEYDIDLNELVEVYKDHTVANLIDAIVKLTSLVEVM